MSKLARNQYYYDSHVQTCSDSICTYDAYCYDSYGFLTCLNLLCRECVRMGAPQIFWTSPFAPADFDPAIVL